MPAPREDIDARIVSLGLDKRLAEKKDQVEKYHKMLVESIDKGDEMLTRLLISRTAEIQKEATELEKILFPNVGKRQQTSHDVYKAKEQGAREARPQPPVTPIGQRHDIPGSHAGTSMTKPLLSATPKPAAESDSVLQELSMKDLQDPPEELAD